jgi:hypothetical protein
MTYVVQCDMCNRVAARIEEIDICQFYLAKNCIGGVVSKCAISFMVPHCHNREGLTHYTMEIFNALPSQGMGSHVHGTPHERSPTIIWAK